MEFSQGLPPTGCLLTPWVSIQNPGPEKFQEVKKKTCQFQCSEKSRVPGMGGGGNGVWGWIDWMFLWTRKLTNHEVRPARQRQSKKRAKRDSWSCLDWLKQDQELDPRLAETVHRGSREGFLVLLKIVSSNRTSFKCTLNSFWRQI